MKKYKLFMLALIICATSQGQITANYSLSNASTLALNDIWNFSLNSTNSIQSVRIEIDLATNDNATILVVTTPVVSLNSGFNTSFGYVAGQSSFSYGSNSLAQSFQASGTITGGSYSLCVRVFAPNETDVLAEDCIQLTLSSNFPFFLISPSDMDTIHTLVPLLTWLPLSSNPPNLNYHLRLAEIIDDQTNEEALESNMLLVDVAGLTSNSLNYPMQSPPLTSGKKYAWQVDALSGQAVVATTDPWRFFIGIPSFDSSSVFDCYRDITPTINSNDYLFKDIIKFSFENRSNYKNLKYRIVNLSSGANVNCNQVILLQNGTNKIDLDASNCNVSIDTPYLLEALDGFGKVYRLSFRMKN